MAVNEGTRRLERERILTLLYEAEMKAEPVEAVVAALPVPPSTFVVETAVGVASATDELDEVLARHAIDWSIDRMTVIDRTVLRIATWELRNRPALSVAVIIAEAIELAKRFSTEESGRFVNGVLAAVAAEVREG